MLVLSLFPGIGLLDMAFEMEGFTVVRGPDVLWGGDIRRFHPPLGKFDGVIGGPPCQAHVPYANMNRAQGKRVAEDLVGEFLRCVSECLPEWFLMENSIRVPEVEVEGYDVQVLDANAIQFGSSQSRARRFQFGSHGVVIMPEFVALGTGRCEPVCLASEGRSGRIVNRRMPDGEPNSVYIRRRDFPTFCELQGLPPDFLEDAPFLMGDKYKVVGNGVPIPMGRAIAKAVREAVYESNGAKP